MVAAAFAVALLVPALVYASRRARRRLAAVSRRAYVDELTELPNRTRFRDEVAEALAAGGHSHAAVLLLDLDRFKEVNGTFGHAAGDQVLREVATRLATLKAPGFVLARLGGDEFAILALVDADSAFTLGRSMLHALKLPFELDGI